MKEIGKRVTLFIISLLITGSLCAPASVSFGSVTPLADVNRLTFSVTDNNPNVDLIQVAADIPSINNVMYYTASGQSISVKNTMGYEAFKLEIYDSNYQDMTDEYLKMRQEVLSINDTAVFDISGLPDGDYIIYIEGMAVGEYYRYLYNKKRLSVINGTAVFNEMPKFITFEGIPEHLNYDGSTPRDVSFTFRNSDKSVHESIYTPYDTKAVVEYGNQGLADGEYVITISVSAGISYPVYSHEMPVVIDNGLLKPINTDKTYLKLSNIPNINGGYEVVAVVLYLNKPNGEEITIKYVYDDFFGVNTTQYSTDMFTSVNGFDRFYGETQDYTRDLYFDITGCLNEDGMYYAQVAYTVLIDKTEEGNAFSAILGSGQRVLRTDNNYGFVLLPNAMNTIHVTNGQIYFEGPYSNKKLFLTYIDNVLAKVTAEAKTEDEKVKAVYDFLIYQFSHENKPIREDAAKIMEERKLNLSAYELLSYFDVSTKQEEQAFRLFLEKQGVCDNFTAAFSVMLNRLGIECESWGGNFVNTDGTKDPHAWNRAKVDGQWYWYDVDVEGTVFRRDRGSVSYFLYKQTDEAMKKYHSDAYLNFASNEIIINTPAPDEEYNYAALDVSAEEAYEPSPTPSPAPAPEQGVLSGGTYMIQHKGSDKYVTVADGSAIVGTNVHLWEAENTLSQYFRFESLHDGQYRIVPLCSLANSLDVSNASTDDRANIHSWERNDTSAQHWDIIDCGDGYYKFIAECSGKAMDVDNNSSDNGANIQQFVDNGTDAQRFRLNKVK
jgi:transglutaminase-like putative cysteine protease